MYNNLTYIIWLALFLGLPLLALLVVARRALWRRRRALFWLLAGALAGGWAWIGGLPIEEWIWIAGVTLLFGCVTVTMVEPRTEHKEPTA